MSFNLFARRPGAAAIILGAAAFSLLVGLGVWQIWRLVEKRQLIATIETRITAPAVDLPASGVEPAAWRYRRVRLRGVFQHDREFHLFSTNRAGKSGYQVITPLVRPDGLVVLVDRGWVPADRKDPATRPQGQVAGEVTVVGLVHAPWRRGWFVPANDPARNLWFYGDLAAMAAHLGAARVAPVFVDADATPNPGGLPVGGQTKIVIRNDHLQYAITWFALALALAVMFVLYHRRPSA